MSLPVYLQAICFLWWLMVLVESAPSLCQNWGFQENRQKISFSKISFKANAYFLLNAVSWQGGPFCETLSRADQFCIGGSLITGIISFAVVHRLLTNPPTNVKSIVWSAISEILNVAYNNLAHWSDLWMRLPMQITMGGQKLSHLWCEAAAEKGIAKPGSCLADEA